MPGVARVGVDNALGVITGPGVPTVLVNGSPISVVGDTVAAHGDPPHTQPTIVSGSATVRAGGKPVTVQSVSTASCGHPVFTGSTNVQAT
jgi:uncharacterized Zn-binding protein involved in type VI secretion